MKLIHAALFAMLTLSESGRAEPLTLPEERAKAIERMSRYREIALVKEIPGPIAKLCGIPEGAMADPGRDWNPGCVVVKGLPSRRLIWAVSDGDYYVVHYEQGGIAHFFNVVVAKWRRGETAPGFSWSGMGGPLKDFAAFRAALGGKARDGLGY